MSLDDRITPEMQAWIDANQNPHPPTAEQIDRAAAAFRTATKPDTGQADVA